MNKAFPQQLLIRAIIQAMLLNPTTGQKSEPCLQRNFTVRSAEETDTYGRQAVEADGDGEAMSAEDQNWLGLEGVTRVNSLVQLPRFSEERPDP
ncbi:hypothetical protein OIU85_003070 [Salix viminalis]|uniref:Uncharacterized protein n=1 Tax=Salix viminalis TaxID=40686 RepID=A0A9Q0PYY2_SALVM|nr:hypothetical protein OIU85_003070 [Salix viminalis]